MLRACEVHRNTNMEFPLNTFQLYEQDRVGWHDKNTNRSDHCNQKIGAFCGFFQVPDVPKILYFVHDKDMKNCCLIPKPVGDSEDHDADHQQPTGAQAMCASVLRSSHAAVTPCSRPGAPACGADPA